MKEFTTAAARAAQPEEAEQTLPFKIDGEEYVAYLPEPGQLAILMASIGQHTTEMDQIAGIIDFFVAVLDERSHKTIVRKLLDRKDPLGIEHVEEIMMWMIEQWSGRPTGAPSVSTSSQQTDGFTLTAGAQA